MKKKIYDRESKLLITVNAFSIYSPLDVIWCVIRCQECFVFICYDNKNYKHQVIIPRFGYNVDYKNDHTKFLSVF